MATESIPHPLDILRRRPITDTYTTKQKGDDFEEGGSRFLEARGASNIRDPKLRAKGKDLGVDRLLDDHDGIPAAAQMKCYDPSGSVDRHHLTNFVEEARALGAKRLYLLTTTNRISGNALPVVHANDIIVLRYDDLIEVECWDPAAPASVPAPVVVDRPLSLAAIEAARRVVDKGQVIAGCGAGKTLMQATLIGDIPEHRAALFAPTRGLLEQTAGTIRRQLPDRPMLGVMLATGGLPFPTTTDVDTLREWMAEHPTGIVLSTYASSHTVLAATDEPFGLVILDEGHRTAGGKAFEADRIPRYKQSVYVPADKRLVFTATPRSHNAASKRLIRDRGYIGHSQNEPGTYGGVAAEITTKMLCDAGSVVPPTLILPLVGNPDVLEQIGEDGITDALDEVPGASVADIAAVMSLLKTIRDNRPLAALTYSRRVDGARLLARMIRHLAERFKVKVNVISASGEDGNSDEATKHLKNRDPDVCHIVCNAKLFSEGIDIEGVGLVMFADSKYSTVDITQCMGRAQRLDDGKTEALVLLPTFVGDATSASEALADGRDSNVYRVTSVLMAMGWAPEQVDIVANGSRRPGRGVARGADPVIVYEVPARIDLDDTFAVIESIVVDGVHPDLVVDYTELAKIELVRLGCTLDSYARHSRIAFRDRRGHPRTSTLSSLKQADDIDDFHQLCLPCREEEAHELAPRLEVEVVGIVSGAGVSENVKIRDRKGHIRLTNNARMRRAVNADTFHTRCVECAKESALEHCDRLGVAYVGVDGSETLFIDSNGHERRITTHRLVGSTPTSINKHCRECRHLEVTTNAKRLDCTFIRVDDNGKSLVIRDRRGHERSVSRRSLRESPGADAFHKPCKECWWDALHEQCARLECEYVSGDSDITLVVKDSLGRTRRTRVYRMVKSPSPEAWLWAFRGKSAA